MPHAPVHLRFAIKELFQMNTFSYSLLKTCDDNNIQVLRETYPAGLTFVVGDTHGAYDTLKRLMEKIRFDAKKDHVFFTGDYNEGGDPRSLLKLLSRYAGENFVFSAEYTPNRSYVFGGSIDRITNASPDMKTISSSINKMPVFSASEAQ